MKATAETVDQFLHDLTFNSKYTFLEAGKDDKELQEIAEKRGIVLPSPDLAVFKSRFAMVDKANRNGCILEKDDVEKSLNTLVGKRVDLDHITRKVVGYFIDAKLEKDVIYSYGCIFKSSFGDEFDEMKKMMEEGTVGVSFEAYGIREFHNDGNYSLKDIHMAGGGLLLTTQPAEPTARVMELAKVMTPPKEFLHLDSNIQSNGDSTNTKMAEDSKPVTTVTEQAQYYIWDMESILRAVGQVTIPGTEYPFMMSEICLIDFKNNIVECEYVEMPKDGEENEEEDKEDENMESDSSKKIRVQIKLTPTVKKMEAAREISKVTKMVKCSKCETHLPMTNEDLLKCGKCGNEMKHKDTSNASTEGDTMEQEKKLAELAAEVEKLKSSVGEKDTEIASLKAKIDELTKTGEEVTKENASLKETVAKFEKAEKDAKVASRKAELAEFAAEMKDEDLLDDVKFEMAKKDKKIKDLENEVKKASKGKEQASTNGKVVLDMGKTNTTGTDPLFEAQRRVHEYAFGPNGEASKEE